MYTNHYYLTNNSKNPHLSDAIEHEYPPTPPMDSILIQSEFETFDTENDNEISDDLSDVESVPAYNFPKLNGDFVTHHKFDYFGKTSKVNFS